MKFNLVNEDEVMQLKDFSAGAEEKKQLLPGQLEIIYAGKWFKLFVPEKFGGLNLSLPEALRLEEDFARIDGSLGWTITLCAGANLFVGYIRPSLAETIFHNEKVCLGGSGASTGTAQVLEDGYLINGFWKYATGAPHLTHFTANCKLEKDGIELTDSNGQPVIHSFIFTREEVTIHEDWNTMGLKATASNSFEVKDLKVDKERMFIISDQNIFIDEPVYRYPFLQFAETTLAVNSLGMAAHFLDEVSKLFNGKRAAGRLTAEKFNEANDKISDAINTLTGIREQFYFAVDDSWRQLLASNKIDENLLGRISSLSKQLAKTTRVLVADIYPLCGISATENGATINRIFRDTFTGSQHSLLNS